MLVKIPALLSPGQVAAFQARLSDAVWDDGRITAGHQSSKVKVNLQIGGDTAAGRELGRHVLEALEASALFLSAALPRHVFPPLFNRYDEGMVFGAHVDNAVRQVGGTAHRIRTDLSATLFLSDPSDYDGGELVIESGSEEDRIKLAAGDMILYPARTVHRVEPVTRGARVACFFWVQSMVRGRDQRQMLFDLDLSIRALGAEVGDNPSIVRLTSLYHNLLRDWAEL
jgi:PKHD-type hydroxylase